MTGVIRSAVLIATLAGGLGTTGCRTSGVVGGDAVGESAYVKFDNPILAHRVKIVGIEHDFVGDLMRAHVTMKSNRHKNQKLQYKFSWYDDQGIEIDPGAKPYRDLPLQGLDAVSVTSVAPNATAKEFKIRLREVD